MLAFYTKDKGTAVRMLDKVRVVVKATSLGGTHSIANQPAGLSHVYLSEAERQEIGITDCMIRLSVGLENPEDIISDFKQAFEKASKGEE